MTENPSDPRFYLLDTSALLTLIEDEAGSDRVEEILRGQSVLIPFVAGLETYYISIQEGSIEEAERRFALIQQLPARWLDQVTDTVLRSAGRLKAAHRMSFADALIAGFADAHGAILIHKDPEYATLPPSIEQENLPYK